MSDFKKKWLFLIFLSLLWGSSFILMKKALLGFSPIHIGSLRIIICAFFLLLFLGKSLTNIKRHHWKWVIISALVGSLFPAYLYVYAVRSIGSSISSILNSLTPFNTLWVSVLFFGFRFKFKQLLGLSIGLVGTVVLLYQDMTINPSHNYYFAILPLICSIGYAFNVNIIKKHLSDLNPLAITTGNFVVIVIPAIIVLVVTGFFENFTCNQFSHKSFMYLCLLALVCTAIAKITFNYLIRISSTVFASSVTYLIPIVAVTWGMLDGEKLNFMQFVSCVFILFGVWLVNRNKE